MVEWDDWRWQMKNAVRSVGELHDRGMVGDASVGALEAVAQRYPLCITPYYLGLIDPHDPTDPVLRQCVPDVRELEDEEGEPDPFGEHPSAGVRGVVRRYPDRALVLVTSSCAVSCRHCTRKNLLGRGAHVEGGGDWQSACDAIRECPAVREVILSGGDPLLLETDVLDNMLSDLHDISHVEVVRVGTRVPVALPMRIDDALSDMLARHRPLWVNTQFNHPAELTPPAIEACERLIRRGIPVSNQAVLLRGVNDDVDILRSLCNGLQRNMMRPYYVFQCDPVRGTRHFHRSVASALTLSETLRNEVGGLSMPRFVADVPGAQGKVPVEHLGR